jgi:hypothetical protein
VVFRYSEAENEVLSQNGKGSLGPSERAAWLDSMEEVVALRPDRRAGDANEHGGLPWLLEFGPCLATKQMVPERSRPISCIRYLPPSNATSEQSLDSETSKVQHASEDGRFAVEGQGVEILELLVGLPRNRRMLVSLCAPPKAHVPDFWPQLHNIYHMGGNYLSGLTCKSKRC